MCLLSLRYHKTCAFEIDFGLVSLNGTDSEIETVWCLNSLLQLMEERFF